jgi:hypothetical protein
MGAQFTVPLEPMLVTMDSMITLPASSDALRLPRFPMRTGV